MNENAESKSSPKSAESAPATGGGESLSGWVPDLVDKKELFHVLDQAFDYRGDITVTLRDGKAIEGYVFDRRKGQGLDDSVIRMVPNGQDERVEVLYEDIVRLEFSDKDPAAGKSWETWVKNYVKKKLAGEKASIESEELE
jgi:hypothetical protein